MNFNLMIFKSVFLRVPIVVNRFEKFGLYSVRLKIEEYVTQREWYEKYLHHYNCNKLMWVQ